ncbi:MAG: leucine-rich repeat domain-containing protein [Clostridia bacterium]|nr:leucine-rich repeat domain-containing protein [Clostridia bacterium]
MITLQQDTIYMGTAAPASGGGGSSSIGIPREVSAQGVYQIPTTSLTFSLPNDATDVGNYCLYYAFYNCTGLTSVDLSSLTTVSGSNCFDYAFNGCTGLTSIDLSSLTTVSGSNCFDYAFNDCTGLTSVDLSSLTTVSGSSCFSNAFRKCTGLTNIDLSSLTTVSGSSCFSNAFRNCTGLTDIYFRALTTSSFGTNTNQFTNLMQQTGTSVTHTLHFPSNMQATIQTLSGYPLFGGTSGYLTLAFDLPATS